MNPPDRRPIVPSSPHEPQPVGQPSGYTPSSRARALARLRRCNRLLIGGAVALTALLTELAAQAFPGKTLASNGAASHRRPSSESTKRSSPTKPLQPPAEAPHETTTTPTETPAEAPTQSTETAPQRSETPSTSTESAPQTSESQPSGETPAAPQPVEERPAQETAPPVVSGGS